MSNLSKNINKWKDFRSQREAGATGKKGEMRSVREEATILVNTHTLQEFPEDIVVSGEAFPNVPENSYFEIAQKEVHLLVKATRQSLELGREKHFQASILRSLAETSSFEFEIGYKFVVRLLVLV